MSIMTEDMEVERCVYDWLIFNFNEPFKELNVRTSDPRVRNDRNRNCGPDASDLELISDTFIRGQFLRRTSAWQLQLRRKGAHLTASLNCLKCFHQEVEEVWTRFDVDIVDFNGQVLHSSSGGYYFNPENVTIFVPKAKQGQNKDNKDKSAIWETDVIAISQLASKWDTLVRRNILCLRLRLYIYRERPFNEALQLATYHEPVELCFFNVASQVPRNAPLLQAVRHLWESREDADVIFEVDGNLVEAHKFIVALQSPTLKRIMKSSSGRFDTIQIKDVSCSAFLTLLQHLYTQEVESIRNCMDITFINSVLKASQKLGVYSLLKVCLARLLKLMTVDNFCETASPIFSSSVPFFKTEVKRFYMQNQKDLLKTRELKAFARKERKIFLQIYFEPIEVIRKDLKVVPEPPACATIADDEDDLPQYYGYITVLN